MLFSKDIEIFIHASLMHLSGGTFLSTKNQKIYLKNRSKNDY